MDASTDATRRPLHHAMGRSSSPRDHQDVGAAIPRSHPMSSTSRPHPRTISTELLATADPYGSMRWRSVGYWLATLAVVGELGLGGIWDIARIPYVRDLVTHLGYPSYFLVLLGSWKVLGAVALLVPSRPLLKEWAYAGAFFTYTGAIVSHLSAGYDLGEVGLLTALTLLTVLSWTLRPPSRALGVAFHLLVIGSEEPRLRARFGQQCEAYRQTVSRWVPHPPRSN
jgi:protein-S-isoprenylcysteine O-methyltransferase Ste14